MFYSFVGKRIEELYESIVDGDLFVSLESIKEFVYFYLVTDALQSKDQGKYSLFSFTNMLFETKEVQGDDNLYNFMLDYDKVAYHYTNLNYQKQIESKQRAEIEETSGKLARFDGKEIYDFQRNEF